MLLEQGYMKTLKDKVSEDRQAEFQKEAQVFAKKIVANFKDFEFVSLWKYVLQSQRF